MIKQDDIVEITAEKLVYGGSAIGHYEGLAVFVDGAVPMDRLKVRLVRVNKSFARGKIVEIIEPSKKRIKPFCPLFNACGACGLQNVEYDYLIEQKEEILKEFFKTFEGVEFKPFLKAENTKAYRHKVQMAVAETKVSKRLLTGYFKENTHEVVNIKFCPIQPEIIDKISAFVRENWNLGAYIEKKNKGLLKHILFRISSSTGKILMTLVINKDFEYFNKIKADIEAFSSSVTENFPDITSVAVNFNPNLTNKITGEKTEVIFGEGFVYQGLRDSSGREFVYKISPESFFQVNPKMAEKLFGAVKELVKENSTVLDAYGGVGAIGVFMSDKARKITLVEECESAVVDAKANFKINECKAYEVFLGDAKARFKEFLKGKKTFDTVILDPPRKGSEKEALQIISKLANSIVYVSCNPSTLQRDAKILIEEGFSLKSVQGVDMFPFTHHIESVAYFEK